MSSDIEQGEEVLMVDLGPLHFERRGFRHAWLLVLLFVFAGCALIATPWLHNGITVIGSFALPFTGLLAIAGGIALGRFASGQVLSVHESGLTNGTVAIRDEQITEYRRGEIDLYTNGVYAGTNLTLVFATAAGTARHEEIRFTMTVPESGDERLEGLHARIVAQIAQRMEKELAENGRVGWLEGLSLTKTGLAGETGETAYQSITTPEFAHGKLVIGKDSGETIGEYPQDSANLYPGLALLERRLS